MPEDRRRIVRRTGAAPEVEAPTGRWWGPWAVAALVLVLGAWAPGPTTLTVDEPSWLSRSERFADAIAERDLDRATSRHLGVPATMPGVTTMLAGTAGRGLANLGHAVGLSGPVAEHSRMSPQVLRASRLVVTTACAAILALIVALAARLVSRRAALVAGVVLACEPFLLGNAGILHTDALLTLLTALAGVAWAAATGAWDRAGPRRGHDRRLALVSGVAGGLALLTKITALGTVGSVLVVLIVADLVVAARDPRTRARVLADRASLAATWLLAAAATFVLLWPALWTSPMTQITHLRESIELGDVAYPTFFHGEAVVGPGRGFLVSTIPYRMTPWLLVGGVVALVATAVVAVDRRLRPPAPRPLLVGLALAVVPYFLAVSGATKSYDRYALPLWPFLALLLGIWVDAGLRRLTVPPPLLRVVGGVVVAALVLSALALAPYRQTYVSPLAGGQQRAVEQIPLGWGEGVERLGEVIAEREAGRCQQVEVVYRSDADIALPCGRLVQARPPSSTGDYYVVRVVANIQRPVFDTAGAEAEATGELLDEVEIGGVTYAELWHLPGAG